MSRRHHQQQGDSKITLPITAMLDLSFQLLFFFLFNFNPGLGEGGIDVHLPAEIVRVCNRHIDDPALLPREEEPQFPTDLTVITRAGIDGCLSAVSVRNLEGREIACKDLDALKRHLARTRPELTNREAVKLQGDARLGVRDIVKVMDACRGAGFTEVGLVVPRR